jgi:hypothetical protein
LRILPWFFLKRNKCCGNTDKKERKNFPHLQGNSDKKEKKYFPHMGNSDGIGCKVIPI